MRAYKTIAISGGFDPVHVGHLRMIQAAHHYNNDEGLDVLVILNSDAWLMRKKGYVFMPWEERREILMGFDCVCDVLPVDDSDGTVAKALELYKPNYFGNGGDRVVPVKSELDVCEKYGIQMLFNLGGGKVQSSSSLVKNAKKT